MSSNKTEQFTHSDYEIINRHVAYQGVFKIVQYKLRFKLFDGEWSTTVHREILERKPAAAILPYDPILDRVILIEQFRPGVMGHAESPWLLEIVAGIIDQDEQANQVAKREAKEEANCDILDIYPICEYFPSPGGSNEYLYLYCGRIDSTDVGGVYGLAEENENIRTFSVSTDEAFMLLQEGKIKTSPAFISLQWLQLNREWLRQLWQTK